ncbi:exonuclease domain-containing protein [Algibacter sp.]|uniref:exonuclease domain-containing protein n=1 Tax=Algibacter sp. TaxID=1872428 RepID=UPI003C727B3C
MTYSIIDVETTGRTNRITEISIFNYENGRVIDEFTSLVNPEDYIPNHITALTGIDNSMVYNAPIFADIAQNILDITENTVFVAHNVNFDYNVIRGEFNRINLDFTRKKLCTIRLARKLIPGHKSYSLGKLCNDLNIQIEGRHRARGDAEATVILFKKLEHKENAQSIFTQFLNGNSRQGTLPAHLPSQVFDSIPNSTGIYYFLNKKKEIIYVGKAKNLKKRVIGHFYDKKQKELDLCRETAHVDFELSGSETIALLMEDAAIKKHFPKFNVASKKSNRRFGIFNYTDRNGIIHFTYNTLKLSPNPIKILESKRDVISYLEKICEAFELCPKYCGLQQNVTTCNHYKILTCKGICSQSEAPEAYNIRVNKAIFLTQNESLNKIIKQKGRDESEVGFILIKDGSYRGYGFVNNNEQITNTEALENFIIQQKDNGDIQRILSKIL